MASHDDSVLTSIHEIQRLEEERVRELARRAAEDERARVMKLEADRAEVERRAVERAQKLEADRAAEQRCREERETAAREEREARELRLRAEAETERALRAQERHEAHARAMAEIEAKARRGVRAPALVAIVVGAVGALLAVGYWGAFRPMVAANEARVADLRARTLQAEHQRDAVQLEGDAIAARLRDVANHPTPAVAAPTPPTQRVGPAAPPRRCCRVAPAGVAPLGPINLDGPDPFAMDDGARPLGARRPRR